MKYPSSFVVNAASRALGGGKRGFSATVTIPVYSLCDGNCVLVFGFNILLEVRQGAYLSPVLLPFTGMF